MLKNPQFREIYIRDKRVILVIDDIFLSMGIEHLMAEITLDCDCIFFSSDYYYEVKSFIKMIPGIKSVMVYSKNTLDFLNNEFITDKINKKSLMKSWRAITSSIRKTRSDGSLIPYFSTKELEILRLSVNGLKINTIGLGMNLNVKTAFHMRSTIFKKLSCSNRHEFNMLICSRIGIKWCKQMNLTNSQ